MELRVLRYFWTIAEEGNISKAAELLHITQPTLSRQLMNLEEELGAQLFIREKKRLVLTEAGLYLKDRAQEIISLADKTEQEFEDQKKQLFSGTISIGCVEANSSVVLAALLEEFISEYPQVTFNMFSGTGDDISEKLDKGLLDIGILLEPVQTDKYESLVFPEKERWGILVEKNSFLAQKIGVRPTELYGVPILCSARSEVQRLLEQWMAVPFDELNIVGTYNLIFNVFSLVENQVGVALMIEGASMNLKNENTQFIPLLPEVSTDSVLVWKRHRVLSPVTNEFIRRVKYAFQA
ncbi:LysR family transcriptional regulator [Enterococcus sp. BWM-S5]|uniref:LysR family transcriptional regulator n=1 Tax=Enterococcus larvae TaxID=2794352 RepID=A0ABS4CP88_9ENTE|nr:LysR family transcriptional regulator [Enterococcus larvae]MBP1048391.1 LysR family transcriptional regulator [Enterococcus larvae]